MKPTKAPKNREIITGFMARAVNDAVAAPSTTATPVFTSYYGGNTNALGDPLVWLRIRVGGTTFKFPGY